MFSPKAKVTSIVVASLLLIASGVWFSSGDPPKAQAQAAKDSKIRDLLKEKLAVVQEVASERTRAYQDGQISFAQVYEANRAVRDAELDLCDTTKERVAGQHAEKPKNDKAATSQVQRDKAPENLGRYLEAQSWSLTDIDPENGTVSARLFRFGEMNLLIDGFDIESALSATSQFNLKELPVKKDAKIVIDGKAAALKDLKQKMRVALRLAPDDGQVTRIDASSPEQYVLKATDVARNTITVIDGDRELVLTPAVNAKYMILRGREEGITREKVLEGINRGKFTDLQPGMRVDLQLGYQDGKILVTFIKAEK